MKTGIELIAEERQEQITKHGFSIEDDYYYSKKELVQAAEYCLMLAGLIKKNVFWPEHWDKYFEYKIVNKSTIGQLTVAGAFLMAENDRRKDNFWEDWIKNIAAEIDRLQNQDDGKPVTS